MYHTHVSGSQRPTKHDRKDMLMRHGAGCLVPQSRVHSGIPQWDNIVVPQCRARGDDPRASPNILVSCALCKALRACFLGAANIFAELNANDGMFGSVAIVLQRAAEGIQLRGLTPESRHDRPRSVCTIRAVCGRSMRYLRNQREQRLFNWGVPVEGCALRKHNHASKQQQMSNMTVLYEITWLILPVVICLFQRLSHACPSMNRWMVKLRMAH